MWRWYVKNTSNIRCKTSIKNLNVLIILVYKIYHSFYESLMRCSVDSKHSHVTSRGEAKALIKNEGNNDGLGDSSIRSQFHSVYLESDFLDREWELACRIILPSFCSFSWQAVEFAKAELWCNYWRNKSQKREGQIAGWIERDADKEEWGFNLQRMKQKIYMYMYAYSI